MKWLKRLMTIGRERQLHHTPVGKFTWERLIERADLPHATKLIALLLSTHANEDGSSVEVGVARIANACDWSEKYVRGQMDLLRSLGLIERTRPATRVRADRHQLTFPADDTAPVPMRLDIDGMRYGDRKRGRGGRKPKADGTGVPVNEGDEGNSSSGDSGDDRNSSSGHKPDEGNWSSGEDVAPADPTELEFRITGTGVPDDRNSSSANQPIPTKTNPVVKYPTTLSAIAEQDSQKQSQRVDSGGALSGVNGLRRESRKDPGDDISDADRVYRDARRILAEVSDAERDRALSTAAAEFAGTGRPGVKARTIRAAELLLALEKRAAQDQADEGP